MAISLKAATELSRRFLKANLVPFIKGSPGLGKSALVKSLAAAYNLELIDVRLAQCDPTDLQGFPFVNNGRTDYAPPKMFPLDTDPLPEGKNGWLLFLDEFNSADRAVQKAAYKLILDRMVGNRKLHSKVYIMCAGNLNTDNAIVEELSSALQSRLVHMTVEVELEEWLEWARAADIDHRVTSFLQFKPALLHAFKPDSPDDTYPCPRTWEFASDFIRDNTNLDIHDRNGLEGTVGVGAATEFVAFDAVSSQLPKIQDILNNPTGIPLSPEPSIMYAMTGLIGHHATDKNLDKLLQFVSRLPVEFSVISLREILQRKKELSTHPAFVTWRQTNASILF